MSTFSATGGTITYIFTTSGSFVVSGSGTVEYLVVAGGGGGGGYSGSGYEYSGGSGGGGCVGV